MKRSIIPSIFSTTVDGDSYQTQSRHHRGPSQGLKTSSSAYAVCSRTRHLLRTLSDFRGYQGQRPSPLSTSPNDAAPSPPLSLLPRKWCDYYVSGRQVFQSLKDSPIAWLALYFLSNLSLTLYNKSVLIEFPFPYTLTALHALCSAAGSSVLLRSDAISVVGGGKATPPLNWQEVVTLVLFSTLFTVNIAVSNISLDLVTVPFHQVVRATTPVFIILLSKVLLGSRSSRGKLVSLIPVIAGVSVATYGDYYFSRWGLILTLLGTVLSALKTIATNILQTSGTYKNTKHTYTPFTSFLQLQPLPTLSTLSPLQHLHLLSPLAFVQSLILAYMTGELQAMYHFTINHLQLRQRLLLVLDGLLAFGLNVSSFGANKRVGALTMTVAANVKQVLTMLLAVIIFDLRITSTNALGIAITLSGGALYAAVELREKGRAEFRRASVAAAAPDSIRVEPSEKPEAPLS